MEQPSPPPRRDIEDPRVLRALAHPVRLRILEELVLGGSLTATELADRVGESPANCSWHLRQLSRYGFVAEAGGGTGRQRPWRAVVQRNAWRSATDDAELTLASDAAAQVVLAREYDKVRQWHSDAGAEP
ncbi:MAG TPA: helix-turn-helix domain-containing protein [Micromonosporaceae bacterium]